MTVADLIPELQKKWPSSFAASANSGGGSRPTAPTHAPKGEMSDLDMIREGLAQLKRR